MERHPEIEAFGRKSAAQIAADINEELTSLRGEFTYASEPSDVPGPPTGLEALLGRKKKKKRRTPRRKC